MGNDAERPRRCASEAWRTGRRGRRGWNRNLLLADRAAIEPVVVYYAALEQDTHDRVSWTIFATTQMNSAAALLVLGEREGDAARLEEAAVADRAALAEYTRDRAPLQWAQTEINLGNVLQTLGEREGNTARLEEAVEAYHAALDQCTRELLPLRWALAQNNLGKALWVLGARENGTERLQEAVAAYRAALEERTRERVPLDWAMTQNNLGIALKTLGERENGTARLKEAVAAYREALKEYTPDRVPLQWAMTQTNLGNALAALGEKEGGTARLKEAIAGFGAALDAIRYRSIKRAYNSIWGARLPPSAGDHTAPVASRLRLTPFTKKPKRFFEPAGFYWVGRKFLAAGLSPCRFRSRPAHS